MSCPLHFFAVNLIINLLKIVNEVGIQVKEEMNDGITALLGEKIPTLACYNNNFV